MTMKLGLQLGYWMSQPYNSMEIALEAENLGYDSLWFGEAYGSDAISPLAWIGSHTKTIKLGTSVMQLSARTPACAAMTAMTLDHLSQGRFMLGLGVSGPQVVEGWYGQPFPRPLERTREWISIFRQIISREKPVEFSGKQYQLPLQGGAGLGKPLKFITHPLRKRIPILLGAEGPKNVALAADECDGWLPMFYSPYHANIYDESLKNKKEGFEIAASVPIYINDNLADALFPVKMMMALYLGGMGAKDENFHKNLMGRMGFADAAEKVQDLWYAGEKDKAILAVPDDLADSISLCGSIDRVKEKLQDWNKSPVTTLLLMRSDDNQQNLDLIRTMANLVL